MIASTPSTRAPRVVLGHDDVTVRKALRDLAMQGLGMEVVGEACDREGLRTAVEAERPDLVIVSWKLVSSDAETTLCALREELENARLVVLGPRPDKQQAALAAGADAYISMVDAPDVVADVLQSALTGAGSTDTTTQRRPEGTGGEKSNEPGGTS